MVYPESKIQLHEDDYEMYVECGYVLRRDGSEEDALYLVNDMLFKEVEKNKNNKEIEKWRDGKYYERVLPDSEKKLKNKNDKIKLSIKVDKVKKKNKSNNAGNNDGYVKSKIEKITKITK